MVFNYYCLRFHRNFSTSIHFYPDFGTAISCFVIRSINDLALSIERNFGTIGCFSTFSYNNDRFFLVFLIIASYKSFINVNNRRFLTTF